MCVRARACSFFSQRKMNAFLAHIGSGSASTPHGNGFPFLLLCRSHLSFHSSFPLSPLKIVIRLARSIRHPFSWITQHACVCACVCVCVCACTHTHTFIHPAIPSRVRQQAGTGPDGVLGAWAPSAACPTPCKGPPASSTCCLDNSLLILFFHFLFLLI